MEVTLTNRNASYALLLSSMHLFLGDVNNGEQLLCAAVAGEVSLRLYQGHGVALMHH
jgi:hypothetical protein